MRWSLPTSRLAHEEQLDELLSRAAEDWVHPGDVFDVARYAGPTDDTALVEVAVGLVTALLEQGLAVAGTVTRAGFEPWRRSPGAAAEHVATTWRADPDGAQDSFLVWLEATPEGLERGRRAWQVDRPLD
ncbi:hypothetical protein GCM10023258_31150 [Terrabacter aeriphilus]|uniref:Uncharacterized protein n=1 Tax=Terrabacter aeriphilus TaxID=515662 RepID=A0ABP9JHG9_9MICO